MAEGEQIFSINLLKYAATNVTHTSLALAVNELCKSMRTNILNTFSINYDKKKFVNAQQIIFQ